MISKSTILAFSALLLAGAGCKPTRGTASPEDYFGLVQVAVQSGEIATMIGRNKAIEAKTFEGCVTSEVLLAALGSAGDALQVKATRSEVVFIPGFEVDLTECLALQEGPPAPGSIEASQLVEPLVGVALMMGSYYANQLKLTDCKKGELALGVLAYLQGMSGPVAEEIANPDGKISIPALPIDLSMCVETED